jgi:predicted nucleic acid-binding protein
MQVVVDASAALKWQFEDEEATEPATSLLRDFIDGKIELISPTLFPYEILSAVNVAVNRGRISEEAGYRAINYITSVGIELRRFEDLIEATFRMARQYGLSTYDCAYLALAEREKCDFVTGDKRLFNTMKDQLPWTRWIGDYPDSMQLN